MVLEVNNNAGNGNPNRNLLLPLGFTDPDDAMGEAAMNYLQGIHDETLSGVTPNSLHFWETLLIRVHVMSGGGVDITNLAAMFERIRSDNLWMCVFYGVTLFVPSIYHAIMTSAINHYTSRVNATIEEGLILGVMWKFSTGWFHQMNPTGQINRRAVEYCCQVLMAMLATGRHPTTPLGRGGRMSDQGLLPDLDQAFALTYMSIPHANDHIDRLAIKEAVDSPEKTSY